MVGGEISLAKKRKLKMRLNDESARIEKAEDEYQA